jgi:hypothetical protein
MKKFLTWIDTTFKNTWLVIEIRKWLASFDNNKTGHSAKKLTAFAMIYCIIELHKGYINTCTVSKDWSLLPLILGVDVGFIATLFGINEYDKRKNSTPKVDDDLNTDISESK